jgi:hypothetical protein
MIQQKLKLCRGCNTPQRIFSCSLCLSCWKRQNYYELKRSPINKHPKKITQDGEDLKQKLTFAKAYYHQKGKLFLTGHYIPLENTTASNYSHVLRKGHYEWFRFYFKNIVLLTPDQHFLFDNMTEEGLRQRRHDFPQEDWDSLFWQEKELIRDYENWTREHPKTYRLT